MLQADLCLCWAQTQYCWFSYIVAHSVHTCIWNKNFLNMAQLIIMETLSKLQSNLSHVMKKQTFCFPTWSDTNQAVQVQKIARGLKFRIKEVEGLYYQCSENKGADQLHSNCTAYCAADLRLCFRICKKQVFSS